MEGRIDKQEEKRRKREKEIAKRNHKNPFPLQALKALHRPSGTTPSAAQVELAVVAGTALVQAPGPERTLVHFSPPNPHRAPPSPFSPSSNSPGPRTYTAPSPHPAFSATASSLTLLLSTIGVLCGIASFDSSCRWRIGDRFDQLTCWTRRRRGKMR